MGVFVAVVIVVITVILLALLLPVRIHFRAAGGTDDGFLVKGRVMLFAGFAGGGLKHEAGRYRFQVYLVDWKIIDMDVTRLETYAEKKVKKRPKRKEEKRKVEPEKPPLKERIRDITGKAKEYWGYYTEGKRIIREIIRFDFFLADLTLGFGDPAMTGWITGVIFALNGVLPREYSIRPSFDFTREVLRGDVQGTMTIVSIKVWKNLIKHIPDIFRFVKSKRKQDAELVTQEV